MGASSFVRARRKTQLAIGAHAKEQVTRDAISLLDKDAAAVFSVKESTRALRQQGQTSLSCSAILAEGVVPLLILSCNSARDQAV